MDKLALQQVSYTYSPKTPFEHIALKDINVSVKAGETLAIIGHTGSGKSTLIQHLNGLFKAQEGVVLFEGKDIWADKKEIRNIRFKVGLCFQYPEYQLFEETVYKDIAFGPKNMGLDQAEIDRRVRQSLEYMGLPKSYLEKSPFELSGGQKRKIALAGILAMEPDILVLDEPTAGLDPAARNNLFGLIKNYQAQTGSTVIFVSHSMEDVARTAQRIIVLNHGKIVMDGTPDEVFERADELVKMGLNVPSVSAVFLKLRQKGYNVKIPYTVESAVSFIRTSFGGEKLV